MQTTRSPLVPLWLRWLVSRSDFAFGAAFALGVTIALDVSFAPEAPLSRCALPSYYQGGLYD